MKKIDMHVHTSGASFCSEVSGKMAVSAYRSAGLDGIVLTNHYSLRHFGYFADNVDAAVQNYIAEYDRVKRVFRQAGLSVILGAEVEMIGDGSISEERKNYEFLLYGADKTFFIENRSYINCLSMNCINCVTTVTYVCFKRIRTVRNRGIRRPIRNL